MNNIFFFKYLCVYFWLHRSSLLCAVSPELQPSGTTLHCRAWTYCGGFRCWGAQPLENGGSNPCSALAYLLHSLWNLPEPRAEPMSPVLVRGFLTTGPPRKSNKHWFQSSDIWHYTDPPLTFPGITWVFFFLSYIILLKSKHGYLRKTPEMGLEDGVYSAFF